MFYRVHRSPLTLGAEKSFAPFVVLFGTAPCTLLLKQQKKYTLLVFTTAKIFSTIVYMDKAFHFDSFTKIFMKIM